MAKIFPEQLCWLNEKELIDWLKGRKELEDIYSKACVYDGIIDCLYQMHEAKHTITIDVKIGDKDG